MGSFGKRMWSWISKKVKSKDIFNHKICLAQNGSDRYSSFIGGGTFLLPSRSIPYPEEWNIELAPIFSAKFMLDDEQTFYERRVTDFLEVTDQLGDIFEIYEIIGRFIIG
ncbi:unnamed protein product [Moneuplotes crassus]|uniref:Uncharacterized protein n=1 Tax=Euplotes crassus TaxID=5936 RepID=A0AAD1XI28_EUPCR|nr:unnamed protein product [Moneuplotes crassus]